MVRTHRAASKDSAEVLEGAWRAYGAEILADWPTDRPGFRPWAFWRFELGEEPPEDHQEAVIRLAERDLLHDEEVAVLAERRRYTDINSGAERTDPAAVALYKRVREALAG